MDTSRRKIIILEDWNSQASEVKTRMETHALTNTICNLHGYSNAPIKYQQSKYCLIDGIYCSTSLVAFRGGFLYFGRLLGDHQDLCTEINGNKLLGFWGNYIIPPMEWSLCIAYPRMIKRSNDTLHTNFVKHDIYQKVQYMHV